MPEDSARDSKTTALELSAAQKLLIRESWAVASQPSVDAGTKLFKTLFQLAPETSSYFSGSDIYAADFQEHITLVMSTLDTAVQNLDTLSELVPTLRKLGQTHAHLGVKKEYFEFVKHALVATFSQELQEQFTDECRIAWGVAFDVLATTMISGMG